MPWPQKNSKGWGSQCWNMCSSNRQVTATRRGIRAGSRRRKRCWNRSHETMWVGDQCVFKTHLFKVKGDLKHIGRGYKNRIGRGRSSKN